MSRRRSDQRGTAQCITCVLASRHRANVTRSDTPPACQTGIHKHKGSDMTFGRGMRSRKVPATTPPHCTTAANGHPSPRHTTTLPHTLNHPA